MHKDSLATSTPTGNTMMVTRSSSGEFPPLLPVPQAPPVKPTKDKKIHVDLQDEEEVASINYLLEYRAEAGDGGGFKADVWLGLAEMLNQRSPEGPRITDSKCCTKWS
ncbi:hypothetical protein K439DRAFT_1621178 [Ramaria rubella]|nr:hypothetical protein K439DRAFT_1621178 [Ramaria rubella]